MRVFVAFVVLFVCIAECRHATIASKHHVKSEKHSVQAEPKAAKSHSAKKFVPTSVNFHELEKLLGDQKDDDVTTGEVLEQGAKNLFTSGAEPIPAFVSKLQSEVEHLHDQVSSLQSLVQELKHTNPKHKEEEANENGGILESMSNAVSGMFTA
eukprot:c6336_g1_i1.p1 GENE.c6336_g1_i1~~c6336_g1_i1.p1  ORF type:complete len:164 (+),score=46.88 c6336_g1_i1:31-492(+)